MTSFAFASLATPIGRLLLVSRKVGYLSGIYMDDHAGAPLLSRCRPSRASRGLAVDAGWTQDEARFAKVRRQLGEYFAGMRTSFELPLALEGTPFQRRVWDALLAIPFGETITYGELARRIGAPTGSRAVGGANARNPISIVVPCHRVIGSDGSLTGYAGGEERKRWLIDFERNGSGTLGRRLERGKGPRDQGQGRLTSDGDRPS